MELIRAGTGELVVSRLGIPRQNLLEPRWLTSKVFFIGKAPFVAIGHSPQSVVGDPSGHVPVVLVDDEIRIPISEFLEIIVDL
jgi:hypothetical protein